MAETAERLWTVAEFLAWEDGTDTRYELVGGRIVAMAPPLRVHGALTTRLAVAIATRLRPPCEAITEGGVVPPDREDRYYQADIVVTCTQQPPDARPIADPILIAEVLSPSTADRDRGRKLADYRRIASLREILLVSTQERHVELWRREGERWVVEDLIGEAEIGLDTVGATIPLAALYRDLIG